MTDARHVALIGFMGAGKTTLALELARRLNRTLVEADRAVESRTQRSIPELFAAGESVFREAETTVVRGALASPRPLILDLGGGAVTAPELQALLHHHAITVWLDTDVDTCWEPRRTSDRPLPRGAAEVRRLFQEAP